jgi:hypothetical protein
MSRKGIYILTKSISHYAVILLLILTVCACSNVQVNHHEDKKAPAQEHSNPQQVKADYRPDLFPEQVTIPFGESWLQPIEASAPPAGAKLIRSFALPHSEAEILVYSSTDSSTDLTGYLKGKKSQWKLGHISTTNENRLSISNLDFVTGEASGVAIEVPFGSIGAKNGLVVYQQNTDSWKVIDFQGHGAISMDLDNDSIPEWVGNQTDWVPPALEIHRWNPEFSRFESTVIQWDPSLFPDAVSDTPSYSSLFEEEGKRFIEIGNDVAYAFFTYDRGILKKYHPADTRGRVLEMQLSRRHNH